MHMMLVYVCLMDVTVRPFPCFDEIQSGSWLMRIAARPVLQAALAYLLRSKLQPQT